MCSERGGNLLVVGLAVEEAAKELGLGQYVADKLANLVGNEIADHMTNSSEIANRHLAKASSRLLAATAALDEIKTRLVSCGVTADPVLLSWQVACDALKEIGRD